MTHSSTLKGIEGIVSDRLIHGPVSMSNSPQYAHHVGAPYIAFDKESLERANNVQLTRPMFYDNKGNVEIAGRKRRVGYDSIAQRVGVEPLTYKQGEREVRSVQDLSFDLDHVKYFGYHCLLHNSNPSDTNLLSDALAIVKAHSLSKRHSKPFKLTFGLHHNHPGFVGFFKSGGHPRIATYKQRLLPVLSRYLGQVQPGVPVRMATQESNDLARAILSSGSNALSYVPHPKLAPRAHPDLLKTLSGS